MRLYVARAARTAALRARIQIFKVMSLLMESGTVTRAGAK